MKIKNFCKAMMILSVILGMYIGPSLSTADEAVEEVVTTGSRAKARSITETPAPVDVISSEELSNPRLGYNSIKKGGAE